MERDYWHIEGEVWRDDDGNLIYYVDQSFDEDGEDHEVLAQGQATDMPDAVKQIIQSVSEVAH